MKRDRNKGGEEGTGDGVKKKPKLYKEGGRKKKGSRGRVDDKPKLGGLGGKDRGDDDKPKKMSVGQGFNINERHSIQFRSFLSLVTSGKHPLQVTDGLGDVLARPNSLNTIYLQWQKDMDRYFLWGSIASKKFMVKFEFDGGFEVCTNLLDVKNPMVLFSQSFDHDDCWIEVKQLLRELFGHPNGEGANGENDYLYAFTRIGVMLHLRIFKLLSQVTPNMENLKLHEVSPSFVLKPLEVHHLCKTEDGSTNYKKTNDFFDENALMFERNGCLTLGSCSVLCDNSSTILVPHILEMPDMHTVMLPSPIKNTHWFGYNTTCKEFFQRYHLFRKTHVLGTGPDLCPLNPSLSKKKKRKVTTTSEVTGNPSDPSATTFDPTPVAATSVDYESITVSMKIFCRSLIEKVGCIFKMPACLSHDFSTENIFLKGVKMAILGVQLVPFSEEQVFKNCYAVYNIIRQSLQEGGIAEIPADVKAALVLLRGEDPIGDFNKIQNNICWMTALERNHVVADLYYMFTEFLHADDQVTVTQKLDGMQEWVEKFNNNWLIYCCRTYSLPPTAVASADGMASYLKRKADELQAKPDDPNLDVLSPGMAYLKLDLYTGRTYLSSIRHLYIHLSDTARKMKKMKALTDEDSDLVISSEFAAALFSIQMQVPDALQQIGLYLKDCPYERFKRYFKEAEFNSCDEKIEQKVEFELQPRAESLVG